MRSAPLACVRPRRGPAEPRACAPPPISGDFGPWRQPPIRGASMPLRIQTSFLAIAPRVPAAAS